MQEFFGSQIYMPKTIIMAENPHSLKQQRTVQINLKHAM
jgi:hypothetical protein